MAFMDSNDEIEVNVGGLVDDQQQPVIGAVVTGWEAELLDGADGSGLVDIIPSVDMMSAVVKSKDLTGSVIVVAHTANADGQAGGDQTGQLDIGAPNIAAGTLGWGTRRPRS